ncbi:hypothetical protein ACFWVP_01705 [Streptomyces sp. NPDC058637]|uniref:hypothetical protein n=1 Tax=Streptomyces sp. NPDC058637 TaxID=3346569 RepID=UPI003654E67F
MSRPTQGGLTVAVLVLIPLLAVAGSDDLRAALDFTTGVLTLVSLTAAVAWGLLATDRLFLSTRHRLIAQGIHRAAAVTSLGFLLLHGTVKVALGHVELLGALVPFGLGVSGTSGLIGFGSLAGLLMIVAAATGALRSAFATPGKIAGRWRALHALAYPAWCSALVHGLYAGRQPATWVVVMYMLCLLAVAVALGLRLLPRPTKRLITELVTTLISPDAPPSESAPVIRASPLPGAEHMPPQPRQGLPRDAPGWGDDDRDLRGTPVRPRTLTAPSPPPYEAPPSGAPLYETPSSGAPLYETPSSGAPPHGPPRYEAPRYEPPPYGSPLHEPPPRSAERLDPGPVPAAAPAPGFGQGISAAYRAVSRPPAAPIEQTDDHWPTPSPAPPTQAYRPAYDPDPLYDPEHAYARTQEPTAYEAPGSASSYAPPAPPVGRTGYGGGAVHGDAETEQMPGPLYPPPAGEPWHAPAGDRP